MYKTQTSLTVKRTRVRRTLASGTFTLRTLASGTFTGRMFGPVCRDYAHDRGLIARDVRRVQRRQRRRRANRGNGVYFRETDWTLVDDVGLFRRKARVVEDPRQRRGRQDDRRGLRRCRDREEQSGRRGTGNDRERRPFDEIPVVDVYGTRLARRQDDRRGRGRLFDADDQVGRRAAGKHDRSDFGDFRRQVDDHRSGRGSRGYDSGSGRGHGQSRGHGGPDVGTVSAHGPEPREWRDGRSGKS